MSRAGIAVLLGVFSMTRGGARLAGLRFDDVPLETFYQLLDADWLRHDLVRSLTNLHMQPPGFNAMVGLGLKMGGGGTAVLAVVWAALGLGGGLALRALLRRLGAGEIVATGFAAAYLASPAALLYESHLFYTLPTVSMLSIGSWLLHRFLSSDRRLDGLSGFGAFALVALTRSLFHLGWLVAVAAFLVAVRPGRRRRALFVTGVPAAVVFAWYVRTLVMFGAFGPSTWLGMNFAKITLQQGPMPERAALVRAGELSPFGVIPPFRDLARYLPHLEAPALAGVPALDAPTKANGRRNLNHLAYVDVSRRYLTDDVFVLRERPGWYGNGVRTAVRNSFHPASGGEFLEENRARIRWLTTLYAPWHVAGNAPAIAAFLLVVGGGVWAVGRAAREGRLGDANPATTAVLVFTIVWIFAVGNLLDVGENYRFRFLGFPAQFAIAGSLVGGWWGARFGR